MNIRRENGYADRLVLDKYNHVVSQTKGKDGKFTQSESNDIVPILNRFVKRTSRFFIEWTKRCSWFNWIQWGTSDIARMSWIVKTTLSVKNKR